MPASDSLNHIGQLPKCPHIEAALLPLLSEQVPFGAGAVAEKFCCVIPGMIKPTACKPELTFGSGRAFGVPRREEVSGLNWTFGV